jgi:hypothetical protein
MKTDVIESLVADYVRLRLFFLILTNFSIKSFPVFSRLSMLALFHHPANNQINPRIQNICMSYCMYTRTVVQYQKTII